MQTPALGSVLNHDVQASFGRANACWTLLRLQEELIALQPQLEESTRQTEAAMEVIAKETIEADKVKKVC